MATAVRPLLILMAVTLIALLPLPAQAASELFSLRVMAATGSGAGLQTAVPEADLAAGARLFEAHCVGCHIGGGNVIRRGRTLKLAALERAHLADPDAIARVAAGGIGQMGGYGAVLGEEGVQQVAAWVWQQALDDWPRSRHGSAADHS